MQEVVTPYEAERELARSLAIAAQEQQRKSMEDRKRRRDVQMPTPSPSTSRSPSPSTLRHRRASDAAVALLRGHAGSRSSASSSSATPYDSTSSPAGSTRSAYRRPRTEFRTSSPYSRSSSRAPSTVCSSYANSPVGHTQGISTPLSPCTPAGPLTPESANDKSWPSAAGAHPDVVGSEAAAKLAAYAAMHKVPYGAEPVIADPITDVEGIQAFTPAY